MRSALYCCLILLWGKAMSEETCPDGDPIRDCGVTDEDIETILAAHNQKRDGVAAGEANAKDGTLPSATNMKKMVWDADLAAAAQEHADQCRFEHFSPKTVSYGTNYGQNLYMKMTTGTFKNSDWNSAVNSWYNEIKDFKVNSRKPFNFNSGTGHFSQVVWADSDKVGCGYVQYKDNSSPKFKEQAIYTCNYYPPGNVVGGGTSMYEAGEPCSTCKCDNTYQHLCV